MNSKEYNEAECRSWNSVAPAWQKWWKTIESATEKVSRRLVELAEIKLGSRVLDIATGIGEPAITAAKQVGRNGHVLATDISPQMLSIAKQRALSLGLQDVIEFKEGDAEAISLPPLIFDAALCRWGLMLLPDPKAGLSNINMSLVNGGHFAAAVWASQDKVPFLSVSMNSILEETNSPPPPSEAPGPFTLSDENILKNLFLASGFGDPSIERMNVTFDFDSLDDFTAFTVEHGGPALQKLMVDQTNGKKKRNIESN